MKADTSLITKNTPKRPSKNMAAEAVTDAHQGPLPGPEPWFRMDGVWYTKDATGEIVRMKPNRAKTSRRRVKLVDSTPPTA